MLGPCVWLSAVLYCSTVHKRRWLSLAIWLIFMYLFWRLGDPFPMLSPRHGKSHLGGCNNMYFCDEHASLLMLFQVITLEIEKLRYTVLIGYSIEQSFIHVLQYTILIEQSLTVFYRIQFNLLVVKWPTILIINFVFY